VRMCVVILKAEEREVERRRDCGRAIEREGGREG